MSVCVGWEQGKKERETERESDTKQHVYLQNASKGNIGQRTKTSALQVASSFL